MIDALVATTRRSPRTETPFAEASPGATAELLLGLG
jgi:hypothetical protein